MILRYLFSSLFSRVFLPMQAENIEGTDLEKREDNK